MPHLIRAAIKQWLALVLLAMTLSACGGGSSSSGNAASSGTGSPDVSVSTSNIVFASRYNDDPAADTQAVTITLTPNQLNTIDHITTTALPSWLHLNHINISDSSAELIFAATTDAPIGSNSVTFTMQGVTANNAVVVQHTFSASQLVRSRFKAGLKTTSIVSGTAGGEITPITITTDGSGLTWSVTSTNNYLSFSNTTGNAGDTLTATAKSNSMATGSYLDWIVLTANDGQTVSLPVSITLSRAALVISGTNLSLGGALGRTLSSLIIPFSLNTGSNFWPWLLSNIPSWLTPSAVSGMVNGNGTSVTLTSQITQAPVGTTTIPLNLSAQVNNDTITTIFTVVTHHLDTHRLLASRNGVALSQTFVGSLTSQTLQIRDNFGLSTAWKASSDQSWLTVTGSGTTAGSGSALTLTANATLMPLNTVSYATVTITSTDSSVASEKVRVGFWRSLTGAFTQTALTSYSQIIADPIRPYVYANNGTATVDIYNVYTGAKVGSINTGASTLGEIAVSSDGLALYALDKSAGKVSVIALSSLTVVNTWPIHASSGNNAHMLVIRPNGVDVVLLSDGTSYHGIDGGFLGNNAATGSLTASADGLHLYTQNEGITPSIISRYDVDYTDVDGGKLIVNYVAPTGSAGGNGQDIAVSADGSKLYVANKTPIGADSGAYKCFGINPNDLSTTGPLPGGEASTNNVEVTVDGRVICASSNTTANAIWVHSATGALLKSYGIPSSAKGLLTRQLVASSDGMVIIAAANSAYLTFISIGL